MGRLHWVAATATAVVASALLVPAAAVAEPASGVTLDVVECAGFTERVPDAGPMPAWAERLPQARATRAVKREHVVHAADGTPLSARVYLPTSFSGPRPTVLQLTPYAGFPIALFDGSEASEAERGVVADCVAAFLLARGYAAVIADLRGTNKSGGCMDWSGPRDQADGYRLVQWIAEQDWSNGAVGMSGKSAYAASQFATAVAAPPALKAIVPTAAVHFYERNHGGGTLRNWGTVDATILPALASPVPSDPAAAAAVVDRAGCPPEHRLAAGSPDGTRTPYWRERDMPLHAHKIKAAVLYAVGGVADNRDGFGRMWSAMEAAGVPRKGYVGPWPHDFPTMPYWALHELRWFEHWLQGNDTGVMDEPVLTAFDQAGRARTASVLQGAETTLYLDGETLSPMPGAVSAASYVNVPGLTREAVRSLSGSRLVATTAPAPEGGMRIAGRPRLVLHAAVSGTDADFAALLHEVTPGGERRFVSRTYLDARHRGGLDEPPVPVVPGVTERYELELDVAEHTIGAGSRLELLIASSDDCLAEAATGDFVPPDRCANRNALVSDGSAVEVTVAQGPDATRLILPLAP